MRVALIDLLMSRAVTSPSRLLSALFGANGDFLLHIEGYPWWQESPRAVDDAKLTLEFLQVCSGGLWFEDFPLGHDDILERLEAAPSCNQPVLSGPVHEIFCTSPLQDPLGLYAFVHDQLLVEGGLVAAHDVLNFGHSLLLCDYQQIVQSPNYLLGRFPEPLAERVVEELTRQGVQFSQVIKPNPSAPTVAVALGRTRFLCQSAFAVWEE